ncbi:hypothetical protein RZS08_53590, partial [Arthrospira platensis SPKY1]|nr:hypothetical protein [Arthrospira platensis SPKY1]
TAVAVEFGATNRGQAFQATFIDVVTCFMQQGLPAVRTLVEVDHQDAFRKRECTALARLGGHRSACGCC